jgi:serine/threonine-protein kinase
MAKTMSDALLTHDPYRPPAASLDLQADEFEPSEEIAKKIKGAWVAGIISAGITFLFVLIALASGTAVMGINAWAFVDIGIILGLAYGVYRRSRTCAVILFLFFLGEKVAMFAEAKSVGNVPIALVFIYLYGRGMVGTFQYHRERKAAQAA